MCVRALDPDTTGVLHEIAVPRGRHALELLKQLLERHERTEAEMSEVIEALNPPKGAG